MKCPKCKSKLANGARFCNRCGCRITVTKKQHHRSPAIPVLIAVALVGCLIGGAGILRNAIDRGKAAKLQQFKEDFAESFSDSITVENVVWPPDGTEGNAQMIVSVPNLTDAYKMASHKADGNFEKTLKLLNEYLDDSCEEIEINVTAVLIDGEWTYDTKEYNRCVAEHTSESIDAFLIMALNDLDPIDINIQPEEIE